MSEIVPDVRRLEVILTDAELVEMPKEEIVRYQGFMQAALAHGLRVVERYDPIRCRTSFAIDCGWVPEGE
jgi:hypothetical protein